MARNGSMVAFYLKIFCFFDSYSFSSCLMLRLVGRLQGGDTPVVVLADETGFDRLAILSTLDSPASSKLAFGYMVLFENQACFLVKLSLNVQTLLSCLSFA